MKIDNNTLAKILVDQNYLSKEVIDEKIIEAEKREISLDQVLLESEVINSVVLGQALGEYYQIGYWDLNTKSPEKELIFKIPERVAKKLNVLLVELTDQKAIVAIDNPDNITRAQKQLGLIFPNQKLEFVLSSETQIKQILQEFDENILEKLNKVIKKHSGNIPGLIEELIEQAISMIASDVHFEPYEDKIVMRFRIDGVLQKTGEIPKDTYSNIVNRIKVLARIRIDEHNAAQDGASRIKLGKNAVDMRISIIPTLNGEKIVIRILTNYIQRLSLDDIGLRKADQDIVIEAYEKPFGMILTTGPTGSGKTTTLYSIIKELNEEGVNITTIEDPVEYKIPGVNQIQVNPQTNLTFAKGLRSIVRQDPDIILVGEIRDSETSEIALNAALTGHLLLSTFHANDAATAVPRLLDMGAEPFLLASTLNLIIAQRLVRKICNSCRISNKVERKDLIDAVPEIGKYFQDESITLYHGKGCEACNSTGYKGRTAIFELIYITPEMQDLILTSPASKSIRKLADEQGARTFFADGAEKVKTGITTLDELLRVAPQTSTTSELYGETEILEKQKQKKKG